MQNSSFNTHVWVAVRVKVDSTNFSDNPELVQSEVADAVCANASEFIKFSTPATIDIRGQQYAIKDVELSQEVSFILVDQCDLSNPSAPTIEHHFDHTGTSMKNAQGFNSFKEYEQSVEIANLKKQIEMLKTSAALARTLSTHD